MMQLRHAGQDRHHRRRGTAAVAAVAAALLLAGCGEDDPKPGPEEAGGNAGVDQRVDENVKVLDVELEYPLDGRYEAGDEASLYVAISNTGEQPDTLVAVTGAFADARDGTPDDGFGIEVPGNDTVYVGAEGEPTITLVGLEQALRSSESIPVTFRFQDAGEVTVQAVVAAQGQTPSPTYDFPNPDEDPTDGN